MVTVGSDLHQILPSIKFLYDIIKELDIRYRTCSMCSTTPHYLWNPTRTGSVYKWIFLPFSNVILILRMSTADDSHFSKRTGPCRTSLYGEEQGLGCAGDSDGGRGPGLRSRLVADGDVAMMERPYRHGGGKLVHSKANHLGQPIINCFNMCVCSLCHFKRLMGCLSTLL